MKIIPLNKLTTAIHFPITQAIYESKPRPSFFKRLFSFVTYRRKFKVRKDYMLWIPSIKQFVFVPEFFIFDGASVPKILNGLFSPTGMLLLGALPHDFGYRYEGLFHIDLQTGALFFVSYTKSQLDVIFKDLCIHESGMKIASGVATGTLGVAGFLGWRENRKANKNLFVDFPKLYVPEDAEIQNE